MFSHSVVNDLLLYFCLPVCDRLEEAPEIRLREDSSVTLPIPASSFGADILALDPMNENSLQSGAKEISILVFTGDHGV